MEGKNEKARERGVERTSLPPKEQRKQKKKGRKKSQTKIKHE